MNFHSVGNVIIPFDALIFFRGVGIPSIYGDPSQEWREFSICGCFFLHGVYNLFVFA
jgi:hypothetical protein